MNCLNVRAVKRQQPLYCTNENGQGKQLIMEFPHYSIFPMECYSITSAGEGEQNGLGLLSRNDFTASQKSTTSRTHMMN